MTFGDLWWLTRALARAVGRGVVNMWRIYREG